VISMNDGKSPPRSRTVAVRTPKTLMKLAPSFGDSVEEMDQILLNHVPGFAEDELKAEGKVTTTVFNMETQREEPEQRTSSLRSGNNVVTPWEFVDFSARDHRPPRHKRTRSFQRDTDVR
jgi:hypothetical protein